MNVLPGMDVQVCVIGGLLAAVIAYFVTPVVRLIALRIGAVDEPGGRRIHKLRTARLGGVGIALAVVIASQFVLPLVPSDSLFLEQRLSSTPVILLAGIFVCIVGAYDDCWSMGPLCKLLFLTAAAAVLPAMGITIDYVRLPVLGQVELGWLAMPATILWILFCANAVNLIDGVDGAASGVLMISTAILAAVSLATMDVVSALLFAVTAGAAGGFLVHNRQPAGIFLGDSGSLFLGFLVGANSVAGCTKHATAVSLVVAMLVLAVPFVDTFQSFIRRFRKAIRSGGRWRLLRAIRATMIADNGHIHHRLLFLGLTHRQISWAMMLVTLLAGMTALLFLPTNSIGDHVVLTSVGITAVILYRLAWVRTRMRAETGTTTTTATTTTTMAASVEKEVVIPSLRPVHPGIVTRPVAEARTSEFGSTPASLDSGKEAPKVDSDQEGSSAVKPRVTNP